MPELSSGKEIFQKPTPIYFEVLKNVDSMDLWFSYQRQMAAIKPVKKITETQNNLVQPSLFSKR